MDGAWLVSNPDVGVRGVETISSKGPSGRTAVVRMSGLSVDVNFNGLCPNAEWFSDSVGEMKMRRGQSTADATMIAYAMRPPDPTIPGEVPRDQIECIVVISGETTFTKDTQDAEVTFSVYPMWIPGYDPDTDGDMLPDEGVAPFACIPMDFQAKRVPIMPMPDPCELP